MNKIINILKKQKTIPLDQFINIALYDKKYGYYMKKNPFGKYGDFITSPLVSKLFGEMIAIWCVAFWEHLKKPKKILITELGPGDGSLCNDLLKTFRKFKDFYDCLEINLLEKSENLIKIQKKKINSEKIKWIFSLDEINYGPVMFLGNEFFDSLPIKQIYKKENLFLEKHVTLSNKNREIKFLYKKTNRELIKSIKKFNLASVGNIIEYPISAIEHLEIIAEKVKKFDGGLLTFDYGYIQDTGNDTLQSVSKHRYANIFEKLGNADITSHINFKLFSEILKKNDLDVRQIVTQSEFLQKMGIMERANILSKKMNFRTKADMYYRLKKLIHNKEMGSLFKVLFAQKKRKKFSLGF